MSKKEINLLTETESLERLLYRLPEQHAQRKFLEVELFRSAAGKRGEDRIERKFVEFDWEENHQFLRDINLSLGDWKVQIDGLLVTERGAIIIESKNISGQLYFQEETGEFSRTDLEGVKTVMEDPTIQLNKHIRFLTKFFRLKKIDLPIAVLIVFTSKQCEFLTKPKHHYVCKTYQLIEYLYRILQQFPVESAQISVSKIVKMLQKQQTPFKRIPLCQQYYVDAKDLQPGILCFQCKQHTVIRRHKTGWSCSSCQNIDPQALEFALREYFSLVHTEISNSKFREFFKIESLYTASRLLGTFDLEASGALRNRTYQMKKK
ncbi:nuclease-related domain-containing protein [Planococcus sp. YIM B11945]|uniref:nuclease-related domain-containing protein n=1 Tax=Planococcus sp. YIM B11945 TaxID=3435410 RepID=UPI003D7E3521